MIEASLGLAAGVNGNDAASINVDAYPCIMINEILTDGHGDNPLTLTVAHAGGR